MESLSISVAMATFNGALHLDEQLADLANQSVLPTELVVCDDGSTDRTLNILERFAANAPFTVHTHRNSERLGYRANFMKTAGLCSSDLIAFCDQDDRWTPNKLEVMCTVFDDPDVLLAFHSIEVFDQASTTSRQLNPAHWRVGPTLPLHGPPWEQPLGFTQVFRRMLCEFDQWWPLTEDQNSAGERLAHDQWYFFLASTLGTVVKVEEVLARYRQHEANVFGWREGQGSLHRRAFNRARTARDRNDRRSKAAEQRAQVLDLAAPTLTDPYRERASAGATAYRRLAARCAKRSAIFAGSSFTKRLRALFGLLIDGGYGPNPWRFGLKALLIDMFIGLPGLVERSAAGDGMTGSAAA